MAWPSNPDDEVLTLIDRELERQNTTIQLIASENFTSPAVLRGCLSPWCPASRRPSRCPLVRASR